MLLVKTPIENKEKNHNPNPKVNEEVEEECEIIITNNYLKKHMKLTYIQNSYDEEIVESMLNVNKIFII